MTFEEQDWQVMPNETHDEVIAFWSKILGELDTPEFKDVDPAMKDQLRRIAEEHIAQRMWEKMQGQQENTTYGAIGAAHSHVLTSTPQNLTTLQTIKSK